MWSAMVPLNRALVISYGLLIVTMSLSAVVWKRFAKQVYLGALLEVYIISQLMQVSKKLLSHLLAFGCRKLRLAPPATAGLLCNFVYDWRNCKKMTDCDFRCHLV